MPTKNVFAYCKWERDSRGSQIIRITPTVDSNQFDSHPLLFLKQRESEGSAFLHRSQKTVSLRCAAKKEAAG